MVSGEEIFGLDPKEIEIERSQIVNAMSYKMPRKTRVAFHLMAMEGFLRFLLKLGHPDTERMAVFTIPCSLSNKYMPFEVEY